MDACRSFVRHLREIRDRFVSFITLLEHIYNSVWYRAINFGHIIPEDMSDSEYSEIVTSNRFNRLIECVYIMVHLLTRNVFKREMETCLMIINNCYKFRLVEVRWQACGYAAFHLCI